MTARARVLVEFNPARLLIGIEEAWAGATVEATALAVEQAPEGETGRLKRSIFGRMVGRLFSMIWSTAPYAIYVERGTGPHDIEPANAQALHFFTKTGTEVFAKHVSHPGTNAQPFLMPAAEAFTAFFYTAGRMRLAA